mmetsp:Transcript_21895/g.34315  ORF Transcript_21895/g.34315 Transcript_21895/m.34315 type:complete len:124 (+) Transcript_21895:111-482(+)
MTSDQCRHQAENCRWLWSNFAVCRIAIIKCQRALSFPSALTGFLAQCMHEHQVSNSARYLSRMSNPRHGKTIWSHSSAVFAYADLSRLSESQSNTPCSSRAVQIWQAAADAAATAPGSPESSD